MLVTNASAWIGGVNPGIGYEWVSTNGAWLLYVPPAGIAERVVWPAALGFLVFYIICCLVYRSERFWRCKFLDLLLRW